MKKVTYNIIELIILAFLVSLLVSFYSFIRANQIDYQLAEIERLLNEPIEIIIE